MYEPWLRRPFGYLRCQSLFGLIYGVVALGCSAPSPPPPTAHVRFHVASPLSEPMARLLVIVSSDLKGIHPDPVVTSCLSKRRCFRVCSVLRDNLAQYINDRQESHFNLDLRNPTLTSERHLMSWSPKVPVPEH
ncbi:hypothetical protein RRG08_025851 [Elysia crispata]|uniref:Uncharacterized protein n=1 Tax=Elysia crispata TaxID=231223 RepID=A0AAE1CRS0_9GAST|nr:hypothetical protein RRG08_025851 [Elysia crispata]